jgi:hypothetical protein
MRPSAIAGRISEMRNQDAKSIATGCANFESIYKATICVSNTEYRVLDPRISDQTFGKLPLTIYILDHETL